jgi:hypothetical protein
MSHLHCPSRVAAAFAIFALSSLMRALSVQAQPNYATPYYFTTLAGSGTAAFADGTAGAASFSFPHGLAVDGAGNVFVMDANNFRVRKVTPSGVVTTFAQLGTAQARGIAIDGSGNLYIGGYLAQTIRKITPAGVVTTLAGLEGVSGNNNGIGSAARFNTPVGLVVDASGNVFVADRGNHIIRKITPAGLVTTVAGQAGVPGSADGSGTGAQFSFPQGIALDAAGNLYVTSGQAIRKITSAGVVSTFAGSTDVTGSLDATGTAARFQIPVGLVLDSAGNLFVGTLLTIRKITPAGIVTTLAGHAEFLGSADGLGSAARFQGAYGMAVDTRGNLYVADANNNKIRRSVFPPVASGGAVTLQLGSSFEIVSVIKSDYPVTFQWRKDGVAIPGATTNVFSDSNVQMADLGDYILTATNIAGSTTATVTVRLSPKIATQPVSQTVTVGLPVQLSVTAEPPTASFQWRKNGVSIPGATASVFTIPSAALSDAGTYTAVVRWDTFFADLTSNPATLTVTAPVSTVPVTHTVSVGSPVQFNFNAAPALGTTFQWRKNGATIPGATNANFAITSAALTDAGDYTIATIVGTVTQLSNTVTLIVVPLSPPMITSQPASQTVVPGTGVHFNVVATSPAAITFQWRKNGAPIAGATTDFFFINNAQPGDAATYSVAVSNSAGTATSNDASLTVNALTGAAPTITTQPGDQSASVGATILLSVSAAGAQPLTYQWFKNGAAIPGATGILYSIPAAQAADAASYSVVVTNSAGAASSSPGSRCCTARDHHATFPPLSSGGRKRAVQRHCEWHPASGLPVAQGRHCHRRRDQRLASFRFRAARRQRQLHCRREQSRRRCHQYRSGTRRNSTGPQFACIQCFGSQQSGSQSDDDRRLFRRGRIPRYSGSRRRPIACGIWCFESDARSADRIVQGTNPGARE